MKRLDFIKHIATATIVGVPILSLVTNCSTSEPIPTTNPTSGTKSCLDNGTSIVISDNHGHNLTVTKEDVEAGVQKSYSIMGGASHDHEVLITSSHFSSLKTNQSIEVDSTGGSHPHTVTVSCA